MFSLKLFGGLSLEGDGGLVTGRAVQRHRLALLALLGASGRRGLTRDKLMAWLWSERDGESARGLLNQAVHVLRQALGADAILSIGEELQLNPALISSDAIAFEEALAGGDLERAAACYVGPFLDGFFLNDAPEFEQWAERERERFAASYGRLLEALAEKAGADKDWRRAAEWWKARVAQDPYDSRAVASLMLALEASGNRAGGPVPGRCAPAPAQGRAGVGAGSRSAGRGGTTARGTGEQHRLASNRSRRGLPRAHRGNRCPAHRIEPGPPAPSRQLLRYGAVAILVAAVVLVAVRIGFTERRQAPQRVLPRRRPWTRLPRRSPGRSSGSGAGDSGGLLPQQRTRSIPAYELYLRGSDATMLRSDSAARLGLDYLRQAVALDSNYAAAWASLARMTMRVGLPGDRTSRAEVRATARAAGREHGLNDSLAEAHATLGLIQMMDNDGRRRASLQRALALDPDVALHREWLVKLYIWSRRTADAVAEARRAYQDRAPVAHRHRGAGARAAGRRPVRRSIGRARQAQRASAATGPGAGDRGPMLCPEANVARGHRAGRQPGATGPAGPSRAPVFGIFLALAGRREEGDRRRQRAAGAGASRVVP